MDALVTVEDGAAREVAIGNVPAYCDRLGAEVDVPGHGAVRYDLAYGGNFFAIVDLDDLGLPFDRDRKSDIRAAGLAVMDAVNAADRPRHPELHGVHGCSHVQFVAPGSTAEYSRNALVVHPGWFDRSPCGTGTSARMAQLHARGELALDTEFVNESFIGTRFKGRLTGETRVGARPAVVPEISGRAWITGTANYTLDPTDPFPAGFAF